MDGEDCFFDYKYFDPVQHEDLNIEEGILNAKLKFVQSLREFELTIHLPGILIYPSWNDLIIYDWFG